MFEKLAHIVLPGFLLLAFGISAATETPAATNAPTRTHNSSCPQPADTTSHRS